MPNLASWNHVRAARLAGAGASDCACDWRARKIAAKNNKSEQKRTNTRSRVIATKDKAGASGRKGLSSGMCTMTLPGRIGYGSEEQQSAALLVTDYEDEGSIYYHFEGAFWSLFSGGR